MIELEEKFMKTFGIEPIERYIDCLLNKEGECLNNCYICSNSREINCYPPITDHILLELVCILARQAQLNNERYFVLSDNYGQLKGDILIDCVSDKYAKKIKDDVRKLFEE